jgi:hypothetical protein
MNGLLATTGILLSLLGDPRFPVRQAAEAALESPAYCCCLPLIEAAARSPDPEVAFRAGRLAELHRTALIDGWLAAQKPLPWIDSLPYDYPDRDTIVSTWLQPSGSGDGDWPAWRSATGDWLRSRIMAGANWAEMAGVLAVMRARCEFWKANNRYQD